MEEILTVSGIDDITAELKNLVKEYPDKAGELLEKRGKALRKDVVANVDKRLGTTKNAKQSLHRIGSYRVSKAKGIGLLQYVEISAKSPHFHLLERGHEIILNGRHMGFYPGQHMMADAINVNRREMPKAVEDMVDALLKERGLT